MNRIVITAVWRDDLHARLIVAGALDAWGAGELDRQLTGLIQAGAHHVVVDLTRIEGWDARGTDVLAATCLQLWSRGSLSVQGLAPHMLDPDRSA